MPIRIYTDKIYLQDKIILIDNESFFNINVVSEEFGETDLGVMRAVDAARLIDKTTGLIETKYGLTDIHHLSTGCKTILNYLFLQRHPMSYTVIDLSECGYNALNVIFDLAECSGQSMDFLLMHQDSLDECGERDYRINNNRSVTNLLFL